MPGVSLERVIVPEIVAGFLVDGLVVPEIVPGALWRDAVVPEIVFGLPPLWVPIDESRMKLAI